MKVLILGGTGAMGVPVIRMLAERGEDILVTSRRENQSQNEKICYIKGNAHDMEFLSGLLKERYDVIIDFMVYTTKEFRERYELILKNTEQYVFLSSARVYAESTKPITEESARLLDVIEDKEYLGLEEYALEKARQENCLLESGYKNWTVIRPYITYNRDRLQLGVLEKEYWLHRALCGKSIVFSKDIAKRYTTLTYGDDVARRIVALVGKSEALGEIYQITTNQKVSWEEVLETYLITLEKETGKRPKVYMTETADAIADILGNYYQIHYDRCYDRMFDSEKIENDAVVSIPYIESLEGLSSCLENFLHSEKRFLWTSGKLEAYFDRLTGEHTPIREFEGWKQKVKYVIYRYIVRI